MGCFGFLFVHFIPQGFQQFDPLRPEFPLLLELGEEGLVGIGGEFIGFDELLDGDGKDVLGVNFGGGEDFVGEGGEPGLRMVGGGIGRPAR